MSPAFLTRLGEAAAGFPDGVRRWWTAHLKPVKGDFRPNKHETPTEAAAEIARDPTRGALGPIVAPRDPGGIVQTKVTRVMIEFEDGSTHVLPGKDFDAVFWGYPAVEKFVIPYYVGVSGIEYGMKIHVDAKDGDKILAHSPDTEYRIFHQQSERTGEPLVPLL